MSDFVYVDQHYAPLVQTARARSHHAPSVHTLLSGELDALAQLGFLIEYCALGVRLLRPVEDSLRRGVGVCHAVGLDSLGDELGRLGKEAGHRRLLLIDDLVQLACLWRDRVASGGRGLDLGRLVRRPLPAVALRHTQARGSASADELPFASLGVELELGQLAIHIGPQLIRACERKLGVEVFAGLTYIQARTDHAALGQDSMMEHLDQLLRIVPELGEAIAVAGVDAVAAHLDVLDLCLSRGRRLVNEGPRMLDRRARPRC